MAILKIARMGHPVLKRRASEVPHPTAPSIQRLVADMMETMADANGAGLAAPQVHVLLRVVVFHVPAGRSGEVVPLTVLINPVVEILTEERACDFEGCLSVPGFVGVVPRATRVRYSAFGLDGMRFEREAEGFHARVVQHECDHLDGILYPQRMTDMRLFGYADEVRRALAPAEARRAEAAD
jgi:peptide deformylase